MTAHAVKPKPAAKEGPAWMWLLMLVAGLQYATRFTPWFVTDFVLDDWACLRDGLAYASFNDLLRTCWEEASRPLSLLSTHGWFRLFGDEPVRYAWLNLAYSTAALWMLVGLVFRLTDCRRSATLAGILFAVTPNLTESFHWGQLTTFAHVLVANLALMWFWVEWVRGGRIGWLAASYVLYVVSIFTYEAGLLLPFAGVALTMRRDTWRRGFAAAIPYALLLCLYLCWRYAGLFGPKEHIQTGNYTQDAPDLYILWWNARQVVSWWVGPRMGMSIVQGLEGFSWLPHRMGFLLGALNAVLAAGLVWWLNRWLGRNPAPSPPAAFSPWRIALFGLAWMASCHALSLITWTAGRINYLPAAGMTIVLAPLWKFIEWRRWAPLIAVATFVLLCANQGTIEQWRQGGAANRALYQALQREHSDWKDKEAVVVDTRMIRQRLTRGLLTPVGTEPRSWAQIGNAGLFRGFAPAAMMGLIQPNEPRARCLLDTEYGVRLDVDPVVWHERWNPGAPHSTRRERIWVLDAFSAIAEAK